MWKILAVLVVAVAVFLVATVLAGTVIETRPSVVGTFSGPERGSLRVVP